MKKSKKRKINIKSVQMAFNRAIVARDGRCVICGRSEDVHLQCSHFFPVGAHAGLRFHPDNAYCMCASCHIAHHQRDPYMYVKWFHKNKPATLEFMDKIKNVPRIYTQSLLLSILDCIRNDDLAKLRIIL